MSSPPTINRFRGTNWEECNEFILAIRAAAWKEGKFRDPAWVADFAALHFSHKALTWHSRLPQDVREDWSKLQVALLERWTPPEDDDEPRIEPTPAAAPSLDLSDRADRPIQGVLKLSIDGFDTNAYLKLNESGYGVVTDNANEALRFRCNSLSETTLMERIDGSRHSSLGVHWRTTKLNLKTGSTAYGCLVLVDSISLKASWGLPGSLWSPVSCTVSANREVVPLWENDDNTKITIGIFRYNGILCVAADPDAYSKQHPSEIRLKTFIEPID